MKPTRPIPPRLLPHINAVKIERTVGAGADGRTYGPPELPKRALIIDGSAYVNGKYDAQSVATGTIYLENTQFTTPPPPESKLTIWPGTPRERVAFIESWTRYFDPNIGDVLEVRIK